jgi:antagonist of KipI
MSIHVESPGMQTTVQDYGRTGYQKFGISPAGPMDTRSFAIANILVGNTNGEAGLEAAFTGPTLRFDQDNVICVTGGDLQPRLNGQKLPMYQAVSVKAGDKLSFKGMNGHGCRAYIAFAGGLDVPVVMGSRSTLMKNSIGGLEGRNLKTGDQIGFLKPVSEYPDMDERNAWPEKFGAKTITLRVLPGPQDFEFTRDDQLDFYWFDAEITNDFDRMGARLRIQHSLQGLHDGNIISDGIAFGSIQVPTNGQPIIMMADRQGIGGYAKIGTVISTDLPLLAQSMPGTHIHFIKMDIRTTHNVYRRAMEELMDLNQQLNGTRNFQ